MQGHLETITHQHHIQIPDYYPEATIQLEMLSSLHRLVLSLGLLTMVKAHNQGMLLSHLMQIPIIYSLGLMIIESYVRNNLFYKGTRLSMFYFNYSVSWISIRLHI
jgi:hypothetical protein